MRMVERGSIVFYMDSNYTFVSRFDEWLKIVEKHDVCIWKNKPNEGLTMLHDWCKKDVVNAFRVPNIEVCWAGAILCKNTLYSNKIMEEWFQMCCNAHYLTDSPSVQKESPTFQDHRHDQSLLTIALYHFGAPLQLMENKCLQNNRNPW